MLLVRTTQGSGFIDHKGFALIVKKLPGWIGSILLHALLILICLYWFDPGANRGMPGERTAVGSIVLQPGGGNRQQGESSGDAPTGEDEMEDSDRTNWTNAIQNILSQSPALVDGQQNIPTIGGESATGDIAEGGGGNGAFGSGGSGNGGFGSGGSGKGGGGTGAATLQIFGSKGTGKKFVFVFDCSDSMNEGGRIRVAKAELIRSLNLLDDSHQFNIVFYNNEFQLWKQGKRLLDATPSEKQNAIQFVESIVAKGGTNHYPPLESAIALRPDVIFFLTDGERKDDLSPVQLSTLEQINSRGGRGTQINVIQFGTGGLTDSRSLSLEQLALRNKGEYLYVNVAGWR